jgi:hypothetical protein
VSQIWSLLAICWHCTVGKWIPGDWACTEYINAKFPSPIPLQTYFRDPISHLTNGASHLPVVFAAVTVLTVSMVVNAQNGGCLPGGDFCNSSADCCFGYGCFLEQIDVYVSMSSFIQDLLTHRCDRVTSDGYARQCPEIGWATVSRVSVSSLTPSWHVNSLLRNAECLLLNKFYWAMKTLEQY